MNTRSYILICPVLNNRHGLRDEDRLCHIPSTRGIYLSEQPNGQCHDGHKCLVCASFSKKTEQEVRVRAKLEKRRPPARQRAFEAVMRALRTFEANKNKFPERSSTEN